MPRVSAGRDLAQRRDLGRIERHRGDRPAIAGQHVDGAGDQPAVAVEAALELDHERHAAGHQIAQFAERDHAVGGGLERHPLEVGGASCASSRRAAVGEAAERIVMVHHGLAVGA